MRWSRWARDPRRYLPFRDRRERVRARRHGRAARVRPAGRERHPYDRTTKPRPCAPRQGRGSGPRRGRDGEAAGELHDEGSQRQARESRAAGALCLAALARRRRSSRCSPSRASKAPTRTSPRCRARRHRAQRRAAGAHLALSRPRVRAALAGRARDPVHWRLRALGAARARRSRSCSTRRSSSARASAAPRAIASSTACSRRSPPRCAPKNSQDREILPETNSSSSAASSRGRRERRCSASATTARCSRRRRAWQLAVSTDMLVEGRHFLSTVAPRALGHKALAVNLCDLAACGAQPLAFTLALALPRADEAWLARLRARPVRAGRRARHASWSAATPRAARSTSASPSSARCRAGRRCCARARAPATTSGSAARSATRGWRSRCFAARPTLAGDGFARAPAMEQPEPRVALGLRAARPRARARSTSPTAWPATSATCCERSGVGARVDFDALPRSAVLAAQAAELQRECLLAGGDDYELVFTRGQATRARIERLRRSWDSPLSRSATSRRQPELMVLDRNGNPMRLSRRLRPLPRGS